MSQKCESCEVSLPIKVGNKTEVYFACDKLNQILCADCFEKSGCAENHDEGCMTQIFETKGD